jgi:hypothetical protein
METIKEFSTLIIAILNLVGYWLLYRYQKDKIGHLESKVGNYEGFIKTQSEFIEKEIARNKQILDIDDFHKKMDFKLSLQQDEFELEYRERTKGIFEFTNQKYAEANGLFLDALNELLNYSVGAAKAHLKDDYKIKPLRDAFFAKHFPKSAKILAVALDRLDEQEQLEKNNQQAKS